MSNENKIRILYVQPGKYPEERLVANELRPLQQLVAGQRVIFLPSAISKKERPFSLEIFRHTGHLHHLLARSPVCKFTFENRKTPNISRNCSLSGRFWRFLFDMALRWWESPLFAALWQQKSATSLRRFCFARKMERGLFSYLLFHLYVFHRQMCSGD